MENVADKLFVQKKLRPFFISYVVSLAIFLFLLSGAVLFTSYTASLEETLGKFQVIRVNLARIRSVIEGMKVTLDDAGKMMSPDVRKENSATQIYSGLDVLRSHMGKAQVAAAAIEDKGNELTMAVTITGPISDYQAFLSGIGRLQSMRFPFFAITNLAMARNITDVGGSSFSFEIRGVLSTPKAEPRPRPAGRERRNN